MTEDRILTQEYSIDDGFEVARLLSEREKYIDLQRELNLSALLDYRPTLSGVTLRFRSPAGAPLSAEVELSSELRHEVFRVLIHAEEKIDSLWAHLRAKDVFVEPSTGQVAFHAILFGWHATRRSLNDPEPHDWVRCLINDSERVALGRILSQARSVSDCYASLIEDGLLEPLDSGLPQDLESRLAWLRRAGHRSLSSEPRRAADFFVTALRLRPDPEFLLSALEAAFRLNDPERFDSIESIGEDCGVHLAEAETNALVAWRAHVEGDDSRAERLCRTALEHHVGEEVALEVLLTVLDSGGRDAEKGEVFLELVTRYPSQQRLEEALSHCWRVRDFALARRLENAYSLPVGESVLLLRIGACRLGAGDHAGALATLGKVAHSSGELSDREALLAIDLAERALSQESPAQVIEWMLHFLPAIRSGAPGSSELRIAHAVYLLAGNFDSECETLLVGLDHEPRARMCQATLSFRRGEYDEALRVGMSVIRTGLVDADFCGTLAEACAFESDKKSFAELSQHFKPFACKFPTVQAAFSRVAAELSR